MFKLLETIVVTGVGGALFAWLHVPLAWMLGPLTAALLWTAVVRRPLYWPASLRNAGLVALGYGLGLTFTVDSARQIGSQLPFMLGATALTIAFSLVFAFAMAKGTGISFPTSAVGNIPGGLSQMVVLAEEIPDADPGVVTFLQTIRLLTVIFVVPFFAVHGLSDGVRQGAAALPAAPADGAGPLAWAAGLPQPVMAAGALALALLAAWAAVRLKLPTPWFLGPIVVAAALTTGGAEPPHPPNELILAAQWSLGIHLGLGIRLNALSGWRRLLPYALVSSAALIVCSLGIAWIMSLVQPVSVATGFLSVSPGGMTEMGVTAGAVGADVSMVVAFQMFRIIFILFLVPYALRWMFRGRQAASGR